MLSIKQAFLRGLCLAAFALGQVSSANAQNVVDLDAFIDDTESLDEIDQRTPLSTTQGFMRSAELGDYETAAQYLDLRYLPKSMSDADGTTLAEQLYIVISREILIDFGSLSDEPDGLDQDGLPSYRDALGKVRTRQGDLTLYLQLIPGEKDTKIWKVSNTTVARIPQLYIDYGYSPFVEYVRGVVPDGSFLGAEFFKWIIAISLGLVGALAWLGVVWLVFRFFSTTGSASATRLKLYLTRPIPAFIFTIVGFYSLINLGLGVTAQRIAQGGSLLTLVIVWLLFATVNLLRDLYGEFLSTRNRESGLMLLRPVTSTVKVIVGVLAFVMWLDNMGVNVTALVAGLGVGGLAVALVLQKPLEDIMGAITLYTQQPVSVGQLCTCGNVTGTVEEISLRTTRIRTLTNTIVVIPNALFATASIENFAERQRILHRQTVRLALDTTASMLKSTLYGLREMLLAVEKISEDTARVSLIGFGEFSIDVEVFAHVGTRDWAEFLVIAEGINLGTVQVLESVGAKLAEYPR